MSKEILVPNSIINEINSKHNEFLGLLDELNNALIDVNRGTLTEDQFLDLILECQKIVIEMIKCGLQLTEKDAYTEKVNDIFIKKLFGE